MNPASKHSLNLNPDAPDYYLSRAPRTESEKKKDGLTLCLLTLYALAFLVGIGWVLDTLSATVAFDKQWPTPKHTPTDYSTTTRQ